MAKKKKKTAEEREKEQTQVIEEGSPEAEAISAEQDKQQQEAMADLLDESTETPAPEAGKDNAPADLDAAKETPPEKPAEPEQKSQPKEAEEPEPGTQAKDDEVQPPSQKPDGDVPDSEQKPADEKKAADEPKPKEPKEPEFVSGDKFDNYSVEVVTDEGARSVPLGNLVTTYQQFGFLQRKYAEVKPLVELVEKAGYGPKDLLPLVDLGAQAYLKQQNVVEGKQPPVADSKQTAGGQGAAGYEGPFENEEQDAYYKEVDPDMHSTMHRLYKMASGGGSSRVAQLEDEIKALKSAQSAPPAQPAGQQSDEQVQQQVQQAFDEKILSWAGDHDDYFTAANIGEARLNAFKNFIIRSHAKAGVKIKDLTPDFLAAEFARFDPRYNLDYMKRIAGKKAADGKEESGMFAEGSGVRSQAEPLDEQQKHMADLL